LSRPSETMQKKFWHRLKTGPAAFSPAPEMTETASQRVAGDAQIDVARPHRQNAPLALHGRGRGPMPISRCSKRFSDAGLSEKIRSATRATGLVAGSGGPSTSAAVSPRIMSVSRHRRDQSVSGRSPCPKCMSSTVSANLVDCLSRDQRHQLFDSLGLCSTSCIAS